MNNNDERKLELYFSFFAFKNKTLLLRRRKSRAAGRPTFSRDLSRSRNLQLVAIRHDPYRVNFDVACASVTFVASIEPKIRFSKGFPKNIDRKTLKQLSYSQRVLTFSLFLLFYLSSSPVLNRPVSYPRKRHDRFTNPVWIFSKFPVQHVRFVD